MKRLLMILLCLLMVIGMAACGETEETPNTTPTVEEEEQGYLEYAIDPLINRFYNELLAAYPKAMDPYSIRRGTDTTEYISVIGECNVTVRNVSYDVTPEDGGQPYTVQQLRFHIEGGLTEKSRDKMMKTFSQIVKIIDTGCSDSTLDSAIRHMESQTETLSNYRFTNYVKVQQYIPIVEEYKVPCRIDLQTINYQVATN